MLCVLAFSIGKSQIDSTVKVTPPVEQPTPPATLQLVDTSSHAEKIKIYGRITDETTNKPLEGVALQIKGTTMGTTSDSVGKFELWVPKGSHNIDVSTMNYGTRTLTVTVYEKEKRLDIQMTQEGKEMEIIVVTGTKTGKKITEEIPSVAVLPSSIITQSSAKMDEAINKVPGVNMLGKSISIRGGAGFSDATGNRVLGLLDEVPIISPENGSILWNMIPIEALDQVEIIKGSSSALYGSSALNGVINFRTVNPQNEAVNKVIVNYGFYDQPRQRTWLSSTLGS